MTWFSYLFGQSPAAGRTINHPDLGVLVSDGEGQWMGRREIEGNQIEFAVDENDENVVNEDADYCVHIFSQFSVYVEEGLNLIASDLSITATDARNRFKPSSLFSIQKKGGQTFFYMGFTDTNNKFALWRVQFENEIATYAGFDS